MKFVVSVAALFATCVSAGGFQGCLERVLLFQAYEIDALSSASDQIIGFRCARGSWDNNNHNCIGDNYEACQGSRANGRCTFGELMFFLGGAQNRNGWEVNDPATGRLDPDRTATSCYNRFINTPRGTVPNFPPYKAMKLGVWEYNDYIGRLFDRVNFNYRGKKTDTNSYLWEDFDRTSERINVARAGDHGPFLIEAANKRLGLSVYAQSLGNNPATGTEWNTVDWAKTADNARTAGTPDVQGKIRTFLDGFYRDTANTLGARAARQHFQVFRTYKRANDRTTNCRKH